MRLTGRFALPLGSISEHTHAAVIGGAPLALGRAGRKIAGILTARCHFGGNASASRRLSVHRRHKGDDGDGEANFERTRPLSHLDFAIFPASGGMDSESAQRSRQLPSAEADGLPIPITGWASGLVDFSPLPKPFGSDSIVSSARCRMLKAAFKSACKVKPQCGQ